MHCVLVLTQYNTVMISSNTTVIGQYKLPLLRFV